jgi:hypothetical protein
VTTTYDLNNQLIEAAAELRQAQADLETRARDAAAADRNWRQERANAYARTEGTVAEREAQVEIVTGDRRYAAKLSEDLRVAALENVRSRRAILSAQQTLSNVEREALALARTGPEEGP